MSTRPGAGHGLLTDRAALSAALLPAGRDLASLLRALPPGAQDLPVGDGTWTVGDTAAHVVTVVRRSLGDRRRSAAPEQTAALNEQCLRELTERDPARLADALEADLARAVGTALPLPGDDDRPVPFHGGTRVRLLAAFGIVLMELLVHTVDVARAAGRRHAPTAPASALGLQALLEVLPSWLDPGTADAGVHLVLDVVDDRAYVLRGTDPVRVTIPARHPAVPRVVLDATTALLTLTGRIPAEEPALRALVGALRPI